MLRCHSKHACVCACVHVVGWVENCTRQVFCMPVQTSIYSGIGAIDNTVYTCDHTDHGLYTCTHVCAFCLFLLSNLLLHVCVSQVFFFEHLHTLVGKCWKWGPFQLFHCWRLLVAWGAVFWQEYIRKIHSYQWSSVLICQTIIVLSSCKINSSFKFLQFHPVKNYSSSFFVDSKLLSMLKLI